MMLEINVYIYVLCKPASDELSSGSWITMIIFTMNYRPMENGLIGDVFAKMVPY